MATIELQISKQSLIESILSIDDADTIERVKKYVNRLCKITPAISSQGPLVMTDSEFKDTVIRATNDFRNGGKTYSQEDIRKIANL